MGRRSGGRKLPFFACTASSSSSKRTRTTRRLPLPHLSVRPAAGCDAALAVAATAGGGSVSGKVGKKKAGARLWMRLDRWGASEILELDKALVIRRAGVPPRDLRVPGPVFSHSSSILAREKAVVINLEFIGGNRYGRGGPSIGPARARGAPFR